ncbi:MULTISPECIES: hypothetical protein [unclassified Streptomyces]|uniref:hypothetical protein n=1 Tax=unclassified Streptomyces TaxID=2593676 RepID=UPI00224D1C67|nr:MULTISPECIES: hypothetical protein [unclassified Streptomyces]MCX4552511.1 hypothetical protein [Streptomyces sp. NBC_01500]WSC23860.1 hypothetical protein OIE60_31635 [Streptomyces sp. NBC_01766]WSV57731.1 hypothetical protein OG282_30835 [Streptomyces sp. NBC_01014]
MAPTTDREVKALQQTIEVIRTAITVKCRHRARYALSRARTLVDALPTDLTSEERKQLSRLRNTFEPRNTTAAENARGPVISL